MNDEIATDRRTRKYHEQVASSTSTKHHERRRSSAEPGLPQRSARKPFGSMSLKLDYPQSVKVSTGIGSTTLPGRISACS
jgi:hypothetical protein